MSIKSDKWIRSMADKGMIEPFSRDQVRYAADGHKIVSYGTSSYGYDVRCAEEFKIFTNINSTIVDPKNFDEKNFVNFNGPVCIIPPNSFALARTVEYFRIPRNVLVCTLGKSTYARCFSGDTQVALFDGTAPTLEDMARRHETGEVFFGYSIGPNGQMIVALLDAPRFIGRDSLLEVELDSGESIRATPDHEFLRRDGLLVQAGALRPGDALMPLYRSGHGRFERVYQPSNGHLVDTQRMADEWNLRHGVYDDLPGTRRYHVEFDGRSRVPGNVERLAAIEPARWHAEAVDAEYHGELTSDGLSKRSQDLRFRSGSEYRNHRVQAVRDIRGEHDVYCLTVPEAGNFALEAGVFVRNCGIIVNVTPLEPEWEGHVTLEFSNTTPLPAKIYADEGVAQMLFFESDEVCETSYKDRGGKYQGQTGVTLPKT